MKLKKCILVIGLSAIAIVFAFSNGMADWNTYAIEILSPEEGSLWETGHQVLIKWKVWCVGEYPGNGVIPYLITLNALGDVSDLTYGYYNNHASTQVANCFTMTGTFRWLVPGYGSPPDPNAIITVYSGNGDCPRCFDQNGIASVSGRLKMYYDPIPDPYDPPSIGELSGEMDAAQGPACSYLSEPYPNPFNPQTNICFGLKEAANVSMRIYGVDGRLVKTLHDHSFIQAGEYRESWNGLRDHGMKVPSCGWN
jgi:hypothetical protein